MIHTFESLNIDKNQVIVTSMDADSWGPEVYFEEMDDYLRENFKNKDKIIFNSPQIFSRNSEKVSPWMRVMDMVHSVAHLASLPSLFFSLALSNYSLSYSLLERIGFWDTNFEAVADDARVLPKASFQCNGDIISYTIYSPFNSLSG